MKNIIIFLLMFLSLCGNGFSAIVRDSTASGNTLGSTLTISHTLGTGSNRIVVFGLENEFGSIDAVTYDGVAMNQAVSITTGGRVSQIYYLLDASLPSAGTYNAVATISSPGAGTVGGVTSYFGVKQQAPEVTNTGSATSTAISTAIVTLTSNALIVDSVYGSEITSFTPSGAGQSERWDTQAVSGSMSGAGSEIFTTTAGSYTLSWTAGTTVDFRHAIAAFADAAVVTQWNGAINGVLR